jgi:hypothetical protein
MAFIQSESVILHSCRERCSCWMASMLTEIFPWRNSVTPMRPWLAAAVMTCEDPSPPAVMSKLKDRVPHSSRYFSSRYPCSAYVLL